MSEVKITVVEAYEIDNYDEEEGFSFKHPAKYYFVNGLGQYVYLHTRDMKVAVEYIKEHYDGKYTVRTAKQSSGKGDYTASGTTTRKCTGSWLKKS